jgi:hypothetical protein
MVRSLIKPSGSKTVDFQDSLVVGSVHVGAVGVRLAW